MSFSKFQQVFQNEDLCGVNNIEGPDHLVSAVKTAKDEKKKAESKQSGKGNARGKRFNNYRSRGSNSGQVHVDNDTIVITTKGFNSAANERGENRRFQSNRGGGRGNDRRGRYRDDNKRRYDGKPQQTDETNKNDQNETDVNNASMNDSTVNNDFVDDRNALKNYRSQNRGRYGNTRGGNRGRGKKFGDQGRNMDRHSGMASTTVKAPEKVHGRDDNNWKEEVTEENIKEVIGEESQEVTNQNNNGEDRRPPRRFRGQGERGGFRGRRGNRTNNGDGDVKENFQKERDNQDGDRPAYRGRGRGRYSGRGDRERFNRQVESAQPKEYIKFTTADFPSL